MNQKKKSNEDESVDEDQTTDEVEDTSVAPENFFFAESRLSSLPTEIFHIVCRTEDEDEDVGIEIICRVIDGQKKTDAETICCVPIKKEPIDEEYFTEQDCLPQEKTDAKVANDGPNNIELIDVEYLMDQHCLLAFKNYEAESKYTEMDVDDFNDDTVILETTGAAALKKQLIDQQRDWKRSATQVASTAHQVATNVNKSSGSKPWPFFSQDDPPNKKRASQMQLVPVTSRSIFMSRTFYNLSLQVKEITNSS